mmetsp:Transcript_6190/g.17313  ORF Transcript_6190/g.17313 Transcript_6190/m.17313 type:complete len:306 (+) Transcript_6190:472-1389(+)
MPSVDPHQIEGIFIGRNEKSIGIALHQDVGYAELPIVEFIVKPDNKSVYSIFPIIVLGYSWWKGIRCQLLPTHTTASIGRLIGIRLSSLHLETGRSDLTLQTSSANDMHPWYPGSTGAIITPKQFSLQKSCRRIGTCHHLFFRQFIFHRQQRRKLVAQLLSIGTGIVGAEENLLPGRYQRREGLGGIRNGISSSVQNAIAVKQDGIDVAFEILSNIRGRGEELRYYWTVILSGCGNEVGHLLMRLTPYRFGHVGGRGQNAGRIIINIVCICAAGCREHPSCRHNCGTSWPRDDECRSVGICSSAE